MKIRYEMWCNIGSRWVRWDSIEFYWRWIRSNRLRIESDPIALHSYRSGPTSRHRVGRKLHRSLNRREPKGSLRADINDDIISASKLVRTNSIKNHIRLRLVWAALLCNRLTNDENRSWLSTHTRRSIHRSNIKFDEYDLTRVFFYE